MYQNVGYFRFLAKETFGAFEQEKLNTYLHVQQRPKYKTNINMIALTNLFNQVNKLDITGWNHVIIDEILMVHQIATKVNEETAERSETI